MSATLDNGMIAVRRLFTEVFRDGQFNVAQEILTPDFRFQYPFPGFSPGIDGMVEFSKVFHGAFPKFELEIQDLFGGPSHPNIKVPDTKVLDESDLRIGIRWNFRGTHRGDFLGIRPTSKYAEFSAIGIYGPKGGGGGGGGIPAGSKLATGWLEMDTVGLLGHLNVVQPITKMLPGLGGR
jgi:predicted ester cyclase